MGAGFAVVSGKDRRFGDAPYVNQFLVSNNGGPGVPACDGWITYGMPDCACSVLVDSVEVTEQKYPVLFRSLRLCADTGGPGRFRGAPAGEVVYGPRHNPMTVAYFAEFNRYAPKGTRGGLPGSRSYVRKIRADGSEEELPPIGMVELNPGENISGAECGGGGYGNPVERDPERVRHDVLEGWVTKDQAEKIYGVVFSGDSNIESLSVDVNATALLRKRLVMAGT